MKKNTKKKSKLIVIISIFVTLCLLGFLFYLVAPRLVKSTLDFSTQEQRFEKLNKAQREIIGNTKFSEDDINTAMDTVLKYASNNKGVAINKIWYDEVDSDERLSYSPGEIVIGANRNGNTYTGDGVFSDIWYYLNKDSSGKWIVINAGMP